MFNLTVRVMILFSVVGAVAFVIPVRSQVAGPQASLQTDAWGILFLQNQKLGNRSVD